jgi:hypothetical protein
MSQGWVAWHRLPKDGFGEKSLGTIRPIQKYEGHINRRFLLRAAIGGGHKEDLICIGSEGEFIFVIWPHQKTQMILYSMLQSLFIIQFNHTGNVSFLHYHT